jgi:8-oxo-dGTP pyrophosphatase MutT (NUDIX family)
MLPEYRHQLNEAIPELTVLKKRAACREDRLIRREKYTSYVVFIPLLREGGETLLVFEKRAKEIRQGGEICFPGGAVETHLNEDPREAAIRETREELGLDGEKIIFGGRLGILVTPWGSAIDLCFGSLAIKDISECRPEAGEVERVFTVPLSFFRDNPPEAHRLRHEIRPLYTGEDGSTVSLPWKELGLPERYSKPWGLRTYPVYFYRYDGETIWGMTADIVQELLEVLKNPDRSCNFSKR